MKKDDFKTDVIFRKYRVGGDIIALMPHDVVDFEGNVNSYMHVGQHGGADFVGVIAQTIPATEIDCSDLKKELESIGYDVNVCKRINRDKYLASFKELRNSITNEVEKQIKRNGLKEMLKKADEEMDKN
jgi:preprotein translocase subunit SecF